MTKRSAQEKLLRAVETGRSVTLTADEAEAVLLDALVPVPTETEVSLLPIEHRSYQRDRLKKYARDGIAEVNAERVYVARWLRENRQRRGVNSGFGILEWILCPSGQDFPGPVSRRDARVAASVVQWLGTNHGRGFISEAERAIEALSDRKYEEQVVVSKRRHDAYLAEDREKKARLVTERKALREHRAQEKKARRESAGRGLRIVKGRD